MKKLFVPILILLIAGAVLAIGLSGKPGAKNADIASAAAGDVPEPQRGQGFPHWGKLSAQLTDEGGPEPP